MRKRFKTRRWILIQVNANPTASLAIWVWLWAAREINLRKTAADVLQSHGIHSSPSHFSLPPCHTSVVTPPSAREERVSDHAQQGFSSLGILWSDPSIQFQFRCPPLPERFKKYWQSIKRLSLCPSNHSILLSLNGRKKQKKKNVALLTQHQLKHQGAVKHPHCIFRCTPDWTGDNF